MILYVIEILLQSQFNMTLKLLLVLKMKLLY